MMLMVLMMLTMILRMVNHSKSPDHDRQQMRIRTHLRNMHTHAQYPNRNPDLNQSHVDVDGNYNFIL